MNRDAVSDIARRHKELERAGVVSDDADIERARRKAEEEQARDLWIRLGRECQEYCDYYNAEIGTTRLSCDVHDDTIVVRSTVDQQNTVVLSRTLGAFHAGTLIAHHYRYPSRAPDLTVGLRPVNNEGLTLTYEGQDMSPEDLVLKLLNGYTEELVQLLTRATPDSPKA
jgi:hypothetical protein